MGKSSFRSFALISSAVSWIEHLFSTSHRQGTLHLPDLYDLLSNFQSNQLTDDLEECWLDEKKQKGEKANLFRATCRLVRWKPLFIGALMLPLVNDSKKIFDEILTNLLEIIYCHSTIDDYFSHGILSTMYDNVDIVCRFISDLYGIFFVLCEYL